MGKRFAWLKNALSKRKIRVAPSELSLGLYHKGLELAELMRRERVQGFDLAYGGDICVFSIHAPGGEVLAFKERRSSSKGGTPS